MPPATAGCDRFSHKVVAHETHRQTTVFRDGVNWNRCSLLARELSDFGHSPDGLKLIECRKVFISDIVPPENHFLGLLDLIADCNDAPS